MKTIVAALDSGLAARPVLGTAHALGELLGADVQALHVRTRDAAPPRELAAGAGVPLRMTDGNVVARLVETTESDDVAAVVIGARGIPTDPRPLGSTAQAVATSSLKPVVVVPPEATARGAIRRVLVPLEGEISTALAPRSVIELSRSAALSVTILHVVDVDEIPSFTDQPQHEHDAWAREFLARYVPSGLDSVAFETRVGQAEQLVAEAAVESRCDLIALGWSQDLAAGRAAVVRATLANAPLPVMLIPLRLAAATSDERAAVTDAGAEWPR